MSYRKINVNGNIYEYKVGRVKVNIRGIGIFSKQAIGYIIDDDIAQVYPSHIRKVILENG